MRPCYLDDSVNSNQPHWQSIHGSVLLGVGGTEGLQRLLNSRMYISIHTSMYLKSVYVLQLIYDQLNVAAPHSRMLS